MIIKGIAALIYTLASVELFMAMSLLLTYAISGSLTPALLVVALSSLVMCLGFVFYAYTVETASDRYVNDGAECVIVGILSLFCTV